MALSDERAGGAAESPVQRRAIRENKARALLRNETPKEAARRNGHDAAAEVFERWGVEDVFATPPGSPRATPANPKLAATMAA